jgi:hypothetical protein
MTMASRYQATGDTPSRLAALFILQGGDGMRVRGGRDDERKAWRARVMSPIVTMTHGTKCASDDTTVTRD